MVKGTTHRIGEIDFNGFDTDIRRANRHLAQIRL